MSCIAEPPAPPPNGRERHRAHRAAAPGGNSLITGNFSRFNREFRLAAKPAARARVLPGEISANLLLLQGISSSGQTRPLFTSLRPLGPLLIQRKYSEARARRCGKDGGRRISFWNIYRTFSREQHASFAMLLRNFARQLRRRMPTARTSRAAWHQKPVPSKEKDGESGTG